MRVHNYIHPFTYFFTLEENEDSVFWFGISSLSGDAFLAGISRLCLQRFPFLGNVGLIGERLFCLFSSAHIWTLCQFFFQFRPFEFAVTIQCFHHKPSGFFLMHGRMSQDLKGPKTRFEHIVIVCKQAVLTCHPLQNRR